MPVSRVLIAQPLFALALGACGSTATFNLQEFGPAPNTSLSNYTNGSDPGDKISVTQHTGTAAVRGDGLGQVLLTLFDPDATADDLQDAIDNLGPLTMGATGDGDDRNPFDFETSDGVDEDAFVNIASVGKTPVWAYSLDGDLVLLGTNASDPDMPMAGDDIVAVLSSDFSGDLFLSDPLDYMAITGWLATEVPQDGAQFVSLNFGVGHYGLRTPGEDMPTSGGATYDGEFAGVMLRPGAGAGGQVATVYGSAGMEADFGAGMVWGGARELTAAGIDLNGDPFATDFNDIDFEADIAGATFTGTAWVSDDNGPFAVGSSGAADGVFYGDVDAGAPAEAGVVLTVQDAGSDAFLTGAIGAKLDTVTPAM